MRDQSRATKFAAAMALAALILCIAAITVSQIRLAASRSELSRLNRSIAGLQSRVNNLDRCIDDCHDLDEISQRASELGLQTAKDSQIRVVSLSGDTAVAMVPNEDSNE